MTDQPTEDQPTDLPTNLDADVVNVAAEPFSEEDEDWPELNRCQITYMINVRDVNDLGEALDVAATSLIRYGMDSFYIVATDPDTGREWIVHNGELVDPDDLESAFEEALKDEGDDVPVAPEEVP